MPRRFWNDGQEIIEGDLSDCSSSLEIELYDRLIYHLVKKQQNFTFDTGFATTYVNSTGSSAAAGLGNYYDNTQVDPEPMNRQVWAPAATALTHSAPDGTHNRIDLVIVTPGRANIQSATRNFKNATTSVISAVNLVVETDWLATVSVVTGTPSASPAVPATPAGSIALYQVLVTAVTGIASQSAYTDVRPRYQRPSSWKKVLPVSAAYTADVDDEVLECNAGGGSFALTLPLTSVCPGKEYEIAIASSSNTVTLTAAGSDLIAGQATQALSTQYTYMKIRSDGAGLWYIQ